MEQIIYWAQEVENHARNNKIVLIMQLLNEGGPGHIDLNEPAAQQLWDSVRHVTNRATEKMLPFLKKFGFVEGNGLSPFATMIETPD